MHRSDPLPAAQPHTDQLAADVARLHELSKLGELKYRDFAKERAGHRRNPASTPPSDPNSQLIAKDAILPSDIDAGDKTGTLIEAIESAPPPADNPVGPTCHLSALQKHERLVPEQTSAMRLNLNTPNGICFYSIAGGTGKTTLCANVAHALLQLSEDVCIVDLAQDGMAGASFGERPFRMGRRRLATLHKDSPPLQLVSTENATAAWLQNEVAPMACTGTRLIFDGVNVVPELLSSVLEKCSVVLVPLTPGQHAAAQAERVYERFLQWRVQMPQLSLHFVLNGFEADYEAHEELAGELASALPSLPEIFRIEHGLVVREAAEACTTVIDWQPESTAARQMAHIASTVHAQYPLLVTAKPAPRQRWREL